MYLGRSVLTLLMAHVKGAQELSSSPYNAPQQRVCCLGGPCRGAWKGSQGGPGTGGDTWHWDYGGNTKGSRGRTCSQRCRQAACQGARAATLSVQGELVPGVGRAGGDEGSARAASQVLYTSTFGVVLAQS